MYFIDVGGKRFRFEYHRYCGPMPVNRDGEVRISPVPKAFWEAVTVWCKQGKRLDGDVCVWKPEPFEPWC